ncbi:CoB--CoM heterodisulfide reductase iron-sulfur subunit B family protein [Thermostichus vulcanus]|uniref:CoB--CoM heterodisulfide reductase iron-sulfur subunit B family protein n=1 Tax=Thermostichus vulcanus str. 'Rupite' TaxID=2813851 RepID=A0ABT0CBW0_THEVL|nr:CoB--CoM heterodisulfide reductase iron-sulfur subunit B family protein [Thermostichus vulcanus]MCJ2543277.1 CoB--CoM heterodisulfide reductase iron-sulfur subunit B family protein [Thermostichus vulcanus str. 'Rupite']
MNAVASSQPLLRYAYYPGCVAQGACRELYDSTEQITRHLGIELVELESASCCGSGTFKEESEQLEDAVNARNLALAEALGLPMLTHCSTCQGVLGRVNEKLKAAKTNNPEYFHHIETLCQKGGCESRYQGSGDVRHLLWMLVSDYGLERLQQQVKRPLRGLRCAAFYGCYLLRTHDIARFDSARDPRSMETLFEGLGATPVWYRGRTQCCGWPISSYAPEQSFTMAGRHLLEALEAGADCLVTPCPLCHLNLDSRQPEVEAVIGRKLGIPILHLPQLVGLALGIPAEKLGLNRHVVQVETVLQKVYQ